MLLDKKVVCTDLGVEIELDKVAEAQQLLKNDASIEQIEKLKKENAVFKIKFTTQDAGGNLLAYKDGWTFKMLRIESGVGKKKYNPQDSKESLINNDYDVKVTDIDYEKKTVFVSHRRVADVNRDIVIKNLNEKLKNGEKVIVPARILAVSKYKSESNGREFPVIYVDLCGLNIMGTIHIRNWANAFVPNIELEAKPGDVVYVVVVKKRMTDGRTMYVCSRKAFHEHIGYNPWDLVGETLKEKMTVRVKVVDRDTQKGTFFASIEGIPYINILCYNPDGVREVRVGSEWIGYIAKMDVEKKYLRVKVLEKISKDRVSEE